MTHTAFDHEREITFCESVVCILGVCRLTPSQQLLLQNLIGVAELKLGLVHT